MLLILIWEREEPRLLVKGDKNLSVKIDLSKLTSFSFSCWLFASTLPGCLRGGRKPSPSRRASSWSTGMALRSAVDDGVGGRLLDLLAPLSSRRCREGNDEDSRAQGLPSSSIVLPWRLDRPCGSGRCAPPASRSAGR